MAVETLVVTEDEDGMRLDRWFKRRHPQLTLGHLNKIVRTGQVRLDGARTKTSARVAPGQTIRVPPLRASEFPAPEIKRARPSDDDRRAIEAMVLFEDRDVMVLNKPYGLAVQGGSGTTQHVDGMLDSFGDQDGNRPLLVHRLDRDTSGVLLVARSRKMASELGEVFRSRQARKLYWALVEGVPKPAQGRISLFLAKGEGMGDARRRRSAEGWRSLRHGAHAGRETRRSRCSAFRDALRHGGSRSAEAGLAVHEADHRPDPSAPRACRGDRSSDRGRPQIRRSRRPAELARSIPSRAIPSGVERKLHLLARRLVLPHPRGGTLDVSAPLPPHMQATWDLFGFDVKQYDPIENAPED